MNFEQIKAFVEYKAIQFFGDYGHPKSLDKKIKWCHERYVYRTLAKILSYGQKTYTQRIDELAAFFKSHWELIHATDVCYTTTPHDELTRVLCGIATDLVAPVKKVAPIQILMPTVATAHLTNTHFNLENFSLTEIVETHIASQEGTFLIPLKKALQFASCTDHKTIINDYYDFDIDGESCYYAESEVTAFYNSCSELKRLVDIQQQLASLENEAQNLFSQVKRLQKKLSINSKDGIGYENTAGEGAYSAISVFFTFFDEFLSDQDRQTIPASLSREINLLRSFGEPVFTASPDGQRKFVSQQENFKSCLAERSKQLKMICQSEATELRKIGISDDTKKVLLDKLQSDYEEEKRAFQVALKSKKLTYSKRKLTANLLTVFSVPIEFSSLSDVNELKTLEPVDIEILLSFEHVKIQALLSIHSTIDLISFLIDLSWERAKVFLNAVKDYLHLIIKSSNDLLGILSVFDFDYEKFSFIVSAIKSNAKLTLKIKNSFNFIFLNLNSDQRTILLEEVGEFLPRNSIGFIDLLVLPTLTSTQFSLLWKRKPPIFEIREIFEIFSLKHCTNSHKAELIDELHANKTKIHFSTDNLKALIEKVVQGCISEAQICDVLQYGFNVCVNTIDDVDRLLSSLERESILYQQHVEKYSIQFIQSIDFSSSESTYCCGLFKKKSTLIEKQNTVIYFALRIMQRHYQGSKKQELQELLRTRYKLNLKIDTLTEIGWRLGYGRLNSALSLLSTHMTEHPFRIRMGAILEALDTKPSFCCC